MSAEFLLDTLDDFAELVNKRKKHPRNINEIETLGFLLGKKFYRSPKELSALRYACRLMDIGEISIPQVIINQNSSIPLTQPQKDMINNHVITSVKILEETTVSNPSGHPFFGMVKDIIYHHHENFDGTGFPNRSSGHQIPILSRILRVASSYIAMKYQREYNLSYGISYARNQINTYAGSHFCPHVVLALKSIWKAFPDL